MKGSDSIKEQTKGYEPSLSGAVIIVTGAGGGIGLAIAKAFAREDSVVCIVDINEQTANEAADEINASGGKAVSYRVDVSSRDEVHGLVAAVIEKFGQIDVLVNNAIAVRFEPIEAIEENTVDLMFGVGLKGTLWGIQAVIPHMKSRSRGSIINISSPLAIGGSPNRAVYCTVKGGVSSLTRQAAVELGKHGIRVNSVAPGRMPTPGSVKVVNEEGFKLAVEKSVVGRPNTPDEVANAVVFLASDRSSGVNGHMILVEGGMTVSLL